MNWRSHSALPKFRCLGLTDIDRTGKERYTPVKSIEKRLVAMCFGLMSGGVGVAAPAAAAPSPELSATETINQLQSEGYRVILSKVGNGSIDDCTVSAVRRGRSVTGPQPPINGNFTLMGPGQVLQYTTVYVDLDCKR